MKLELTDAIGRGIARELSREFAVLKLSSLIWTIKVRGTHEVMNCVVTITGQIDVRRGDARAIVAEYAKAVNGLKPFVGTQDGKRAIMTRTVMDGVPITIWAPIET